ncbi:MAG: acyltransferase family protein [Paludibacteraceae bacterium]|nr:acyltransferase family protein [Paludibacteraceae bacterium]
MEVNNKSRRLPYLDHSRVLGAYLVILGHILPYDNVIPRMYIYSFHMALFFIISGLLHKENGTIQIKKYFRTLILPVIFFNLLLWVIEAPFWQSEIWNFNHRFGVDLPDSIYETYLVTLKFTIGSFINGSIAASGPCWFLVSLFSCKCILNIMSKCRCNKMLVFGIMILGFIFFTLSRTRLLFLGSTFMGFPFFLMGYLLKEKWNIILGKMNSQTRIFCGFFAIVSMVLLTYYNGQVSMLGVKFGMQSRLISIPLFYIIGCLGSIGIMLICSCLNNFVESSHRIAESLITILGFQLVLVYFAWYSFDTLHISPIWSVLISLPILFICCFVHNIISTYIPFIIGKSKINKKCITLP